MGVGVYGERFLEEMKWKWKSGGVMDDDSRDDEGGEVEKDWLRQGWNAKFNLFQRWGDACGNERFVTFNELAWGRLRVTTEEVRVQRGGWTEIRLCR